MFSTHSKFSLNSSWTVAVEDRTIYIYGKENGGGGGPTPTPTYKVTVNPNGGTYIGTSPITVSSGGSINLTTVSD